jgi:hypothetical protein
MVLHSRSRLRLRLWTRVLSVGLAVILMAGPATAAEVDKYLPADTEVLVTINIRQILGSALIKKIGVDHLREGLKQQEEVSAILKELGLDPFKDIDKILAAGPASSEQDKGLFIAHGRFDVAKFKARAEKAAKENKDVFKIVKLKDGQGGEYTVYQFPVPNPQGQDVTMFASFAGKTTLLAAASKDYLIDALKVKDDTKVNLKSKAFQELLGKVDDQQSLSIVAAGENLAKAAADAPGPIKEVLEKITAVAGGVTLSDGIKVEFASSTKKAEDAKELKEKLNDGVNTAVALLALANQKELAPVLEFLKSIKATSKDKLLTIKGEVSAETLNKLIPKDQ